MAGKKAKYVITDGKCFYPFNNKREAESHAKKMAKNKGVTVRVVSARYPPGVRTHTVIKTYHPRRK